MILTKWTLAIVDDWVVEEEDVYFIVFILAIMQHK